MNALFEAPQGLLARVRHSLDWVVLTLTFAVVTLATAMAALSATSAAPQVRRASLRSDSRRRSRQSGPRSFGRAAAVAMSHPQILKP